MAERQTPTAVLREEHQLILRVIDALQRRLDEGQRTSDWDFAALAQCAEFFRLFADACHHGKEEDLLFPELEARGIPREGGPIGVMLQEHQQGRAFVRAMITALPDAPTSAAALEEVVGAGRGYIALLRQHIDKEDNILFTMADRVVDPAGCEHLCEHYARVCAGQFEGCTKAQLQALAEELTGGG